MAINFVVDIKGRKKGILLNYSHYQRLLEKADELTAIKAYYAVKSKKQKYTAAGDVFRKIESKGRV